MYPKKVLNLKASSLSLLTSWRPKNQTSRPFQTFFKFSAPYTSFGTPIKNEVGGPWPSQLPLPGG